jgi:hypothetical protein
MTDAVTDWLNHAQHAYDTAGHPRPGFVAGLQRAMGDAPTRADDLAVLAENVIPQMIDALRAVLELHEPVGRGPHKFCVACHSSDGFHLDWPCPTVQAIHDALNPDKEAA